MPFLGIDISGNQSLTTVNTAIKDSANQFFIVKASEGEHTTFASYATQIAAVRTAGELAGAYHFAWLNQDPVVEATNFVAAAGLLPGELACLDLEDWGETDPTKPNYARDKAMRDATPWTQRVAYALKWCSEVKRLTGATPLIYVNWSWIKGLRTAATATQWAELTKYLCWLAEWSGVAGQHSTINGQGGTSDGGWRIAMHQYGAIGGLDRDYFELDLAAWTALAVPTKEPFTVAQYDDIIAKLNTIASSVTAVGGKVDTLSGKTTTEHTAITTALGALATQDALTALQKAVDALPEPLRLAVGQSVSAALSGFQINVTYPTKEAP